MFQLTKLIFERITPNLPKVFLTDREIASSLLKGHIDPLYFCFVITPYKYIYFAFDPLGFALVFANIIIFKLVRVITHIHFSYYIE